MPWRGQKKASHCPTRAGIQRASTRRARRLSLQALASYYSHADVHRPEHSLRALTTRAEPQNPNVLPSSCLRVSRGSVSTFQPLAHRAS